jgi:2-polyprenyl-6-methoxyphenol hydroxylase-like FAD-dependent oxidoreductase
MSHDVVIVGAGPNGLLMASELALAGVDAVVLERLPERSAQPKANGVVGRVVEALDRRGIYELFSGQEGPPRPAQRFMFGALPLDLTRLPGHSVHALPIPQRRMEELLEERAAALGVRIRRGNEVTAIHQTPDTVTIDVVGPTGPYRLDARYLVAADGGTSAIRKQLGIEFPGITDAPATSASQRPWPRRRPASWTCPASGGSRPRRSCAPRPGCSRTGCSNPASTA